MDSSIVRTVAEEIAQVESLGPHLVILGAGASRAAFPSGDRSGKSLPLMNDFVDIVPIRWLLEENGVNWRDHNFEDIYSNLTTDQTAKGIRSELEETIYEYFSSLDLPSTPTLYDHLLLSLRGKDVIATFNWDPFLIQAYWRNAKKVESLPKLLFLHGNVLSGYCGQDDNHGIKGGRCGICGQPFIPSSLLFPINNKDYKSDREIAGQWEYLKNVLRRARFITIFGYGAPASDAVAIDILSGAWGRPEDREFEHIEIIDTKNGEILRQNWQRFIHTHHYRTYNDFYDSWIAKHPRRTVEAYFDQYIAAKFIEDHQVPKDASFQELWDWFEPLNEAERLTTATRGKL